MAKISLTRAKQVQRVLTTGFVASLFILGVASCATTEDEPQQAAESASDDTPAVETETENPTPAAEDEGDAEVETSEPLNSAELLESGMAGDAAVKCDYAAGSITGTIYFNGPERQRFDSVNADGVPSHIVLHEGRAHAWNDEQQEGVRYPDPEESSTLVADDPDEVKANSSNCVPHEDLSVFELPADVDVVDLPTTD